MRNVPFFELDGKKYEIKRTRYLQVQFDELKKELEMTDEESLAYAKEQDFSDKVEKLAVRKNELYEKYLETFDEKDEEMYQKACKAYDSLLEQNANIKSVFTQQKQKLINIGEQLIIKALQKDDKGNDIRTEEQAKTIWESFVDEYGQVVAMEFITFTINYIIGADEEIENPFMKKAKEKAEQRANMKKGLKVVK